jgi:branched-chain amino acid aminotransferase
MPLFIQNGKFLELNSPSITIDNRGFRYGDGVFETIRYINHQPILIKEHLERWWNGLELLGFEIPALLSAERIEHEIQLLAKKNQHKNARIRLTGFRNIGGLYDVSDPKVSYSIESYPITPEISALNSNGLRVCLFDACIKAADAYSHTKNNNYLPYVLGAKHASNNHCNDALIFNQYGRICDSTKANLFIIHQHQIITPPLEEGCIAGIMRKQLLHLLPELGYSVSETPISRELLFNADHIFLSNAIQVIRWVSFIDSKEYSLGPIHEIRTALRRTNPMVFC